MKFNLYDKAVLIHRAWRYRRRSEPGPLRVVLGHLRPGQIAIDVGANKGAYTYWMCRRIGPQGRVIAIEPQPEWAAYLEAAGRAFGFGQLEVIAAGASSSPGRRELVLPHDNPVGGASFESATVSSGPRIAVETLMLDVLLEENDAHPVSLIKCDVEGHEYEVFAGARETLQRDRPLLVFECQDYRHPDGQTARVFEMLTGLGYEGFFFGAAGALRPIEDFEPKVHQDHARPDFCDNFVFR